MTEIIRKLKKYVLLFIVITSINHFGYAQTPTIYDCLGAVSLCDSTYHQSNTLNTVGNYINEINVPPNQCLINELGGVWYKFTPSTSDTLRFTIIPDNPTGEDFDWALFDLTGASCDSLKFGDPYNYLISGNTAGASSLVPPLQNQGPTGINGNSSIFGSTCVGPGPGDGTGSAPGDWNTFNDDVTVLLGHTYYLYVAQFSGSQGYTIDFSPSQASIIANFDASITQPDTLCSSSNSVTLSAVDTGGIWSGIGIVDSINGVFNPNGIATGLHEIIYTIPGVCPIADTVYVNILSAPTSLFQYNIIEERCVETSFELINNSLNASNYYWYVDGNYLSGLNNELLSIPFTESKSVSLIADNNICQDTSTSLITAPDPPLISIPNIFSPNGDGVNDVFKLPNAIKNCASSIHIFNRWGQEIYSSEKTLEWDGKTTAGGIVSSGTYFYLVSINKEKYKGTLTLLK